MNIVYNVLLFEDQYEEIEGNIERLEQFIADFGFIPKFKHESNISADEIETLSEKLYFYNPYDLIIFDYDLGSKSENGLNIAKHLRNKVYTDMIFYSGRLPSDLRQKLFDEEIDGVFIIHRDSFYDDIEPIVEDHIKKMSDLNNMRGVVMSETSQMDLNLRELLINTLEELDNDEAESAFNTWKEREKRKISKKQNKLESIKVFTEAVNDPNLITFDHLRITLKDLIKDGEEILKENSLIHEVQKERNRLAHQKAVLTDDGKMFLHGKSHEYNFEVFKQLRQNLLSAHEQIKNLKRS